MDKGSSWIGKKLVENAQIKKIKYDILSNFQTLSYFPILAFSTNFCPIKTDLSGNTVWPQASGFQKLAKIEHFCHFFIYFCPLKM